MQAKQGCERVMNKHKRAGQRAKLTHVICCVVMLLTVGCSAALQASHLNITVKSHADSMINGAIQSGMQDELKRQGYSKTTNLTWLTPALLQREQRVTGDLLVTISDPKKGPFLTLIRKLDNTKGKTAVDEEPLSMTISAPSDHISGSAPFSKLIHELVPAIQTLGVLIAADALDAARIKHAFDSNERFRDIAVVYRTVQSPTQMRTVARELVGQVDAIYLPCHITKLPQLTDLITVAERNNIPLLGEDHDSVNQGVIAVYNIDYYQVGRDTADLLVRMYEGESRQNMTSPAIVPQLSLNLDAAHRVGIEIPQHLVERATVIVE